MFFKICECPHRQWWHLGQRNCVPIFKSFGSMVAKSHFNVIPVIAPTRGQLPHFYSCDHRLSRTHMHKVWWSLQCPKTLQCNYEVKWTMMKLTDFILRKYDLSQNTVKTNVDLDSRDLWAVEWRKVIWRQWKWCWRLSTLMSNAIRSADKLL